MSKGSSSVTYCSAYECNHWDRDFFLIWAVRPGGGETMQSRVGNGAGPCEEHGTKRALDALICIGLVVVECILATRLVFEAYSVLETP